MSAYRIVDSIAKGEFDLNDPQCRQDLMGMFQFAGSKTQGHLEKKYKKQKDQMVKERKERQEKRREERQAKRDEKSYNRCKGGEPVDLISGSFLIEQCDLIIQDILGDYAIERTYESLFAKNTSAIGKGWSLNFFSKLEEEEDTIEIRLPDQHTETFLRTSDGWKNRRNGDGSYALSEEKEGYLLKEVITGKLYFYEKEGALKKIEDTNGNQTIYEYQSQMLSSIKFTSGQVLSFSYEKDKISTITDILERKITYQYEGDYLVAVKFPNGGIEEYKYNTDGYVIEINDANGVTYVHNEYDRKGRVTHQTLSTGQEYFFLYDESRRVNTFLAPKSEKEIKYVYNKDNLLIKTIYGDGTTEEYQYDDWENRIWEKDRNGACINRKYDSRCLLLEEEFPEGLVEKFYYDEEGKCISTWDNAGLEKFYTYDDHRNITKITWKGKTLEEVELYYQYDKKGRVTQITDFNGNKTTYSYKTDFSEPSKVITAEEETYYFTYDKAGRRRSIQDELGTETYAYNAMDLLCLVTDGLGNTEKYYYNLVYDLEKIVRPNACQQKGGKEAGEKYEYDAFHRRLCHINALGDVYVTQRDLEGNVKKEIHPNSYQKEKNDGEGISYEYDADDRRIKILYPDGGVERYFYDANGNLKKKILPMQYQEKQEDGEGFCYFYDKENRLIQINDPEGTTLWRYLYDLHGNIIKKINTLGYESGNDDESRIGSLYFYNELGWLLEERVPEKVEKDITWYKLTTYEYDKVGNCIKEKYYKEYQTKTSKFGKVHDISYRYDRKNRLIEVIDNTGAAISYQYNCQNQITYEERKINETTKQIFTYQYDAAGNLVRSSQTVDKAGCGKEFASIKYSYDKNGNMIKITLPYGAEIRQEYDVLDRLISEKQIEKKTGIKNHIKYEYDKAGNVVRVTNQEGKELRLEYDYKNQEIRQIEIDGSVTRKFYNKNGFLEKIISPNQYKEEIDDGEGYEMIYDNQDRIIKIWNPDGKVIQKQRYDKAGRLERKEDGLGSGVHYTYDFGDRLIQLKTTGKATQEYEYDASGTIIGIKDGVGNRITYELDLWGRIIEVQKGNGNREYYGYDYAGNRSYSIDGEGNKTTYEYNAANLLAKRTDPIGESEYYFYDIGNRLSKKIDRNGTEVCYEYSLYGDLIYRKENKTGLYESYQYTPDGLLKAAVTEGIAYQYLYDKKGQLKEKRSSGKVLLSYDYDKNGNLIKQRDITGKEIQYTYNRQDQIKEIYDNGKKIASYEYYSDGRKKSMRNGEHLFSEYVYDEDKNLIRLKTKLEGKELLSQEYEYDGNGNCIEKKENGRQTCYRYDEENRLTQVKYPEYEERLYYDKAGNRIRREGRKGEERYFYNRKNELIGYEAEGKREELRYDRAGNMIENQKGKYFYDGFGRMKKIETREGKEQKNYYDAEGLRYQIEENGSQIEYVYRGREVILEKKEGELTRYIRSEELLGSEKGEEYYHYSQDEQKSIRYIIKEKEIKNEYEYDAWGEVLRKEEEIENRFQYAGEQRDPISEQYYLRARYYNPAIGRFSQEDKYEEDGLNLYNYCKNNPLLYVDPSGNICEKAYNRLIDKGWENLSHNERKKVEAYERVRARIKKGEGIDRNSYSEVRNESKRQQEEKKTREERKQDIDYLTRKYTEEDRRNNKYPPRNLTAQRECQKVLNEVIRLKAQATGKDKNQPIVSVFTHEDGTVSVGISGRTEASARFAKQLEDSLNKDGRQKYKVLGLATEKFKGYLKDSHPEELKEENIREKKGNPIGDCAEAKAALLANSNKSPITGMDTRTPRNNNRYPYEGIDKTSDNQMKPCFTCETCEEEYMKCANREIIME